MRLRRAPVATTTVSASTDLASVHTRKGRRDRSTFVTVSEKICVPNRSLCALGAAGRHFFRVRESQQALIQTCIKCTTAM